MASAQTSTLTDLRQAYGRVTDRLAQAAARRGRRPEEILLVAVTKTATPDQSRFLVEQGHKDFGESRVQHLAQRVAQLEEFLSRKRTLGSASTNENPTSVTEVRWHMIGHLQRNKVKAVVPLVKLIHSVDSLRLAEELQAHGMRHETAIDVLLQVNTASEPNKYGVAAPAAGHMAEQIDTMTFLNLRGLMCMAPYSDDPEHSRPSFRRAAELFEEIKTSDLVDDQFNILSMGMTNDFEVAIEEGANVVRVGRAIFGEEVAG